jgi:hypothetical protein
MLIGGAESTTWPSARADAADGCVAGRIAGAAEEPARARPISATTSTADSTATVTGIAVDRDRVSGWGAGDITRKSGRGGFVWTRGISMAGLLGIYGNVPTGSEADGAVSCGVESMST